MSLFMEISFQDLLKSGKKYLNIGSKENEIKNTKSTKKSSKKKKIRKKKRNKKIGNELLKNSKEKIRNLKNKTNKKVPENKLKRKKNQRTKHTESKANKSKGKLRKSKNKTQKKKKKKKKNVKQKKKKLKERLKDDENTTEGFAENDPSIENPIKYNNSGTSSHDNTENDDQRTEIIGPHDDSSDDKVEPKHYLDYTEPSEEDIMSILNQVLAAEHKARNVKETTSEATLPARAPQKNRKKRKKKKKKQTKKPKCNWYKNKSREVRKNFDGFKVRNCGRARMRGNLSYDTMWSVYRQLFGLTKHANTAAKQIAEYEQFLETVKEFLSQHPVCETNLQWNHVMIEVTLTNVLLDLTNDICR